MEDNTSNPEDKHEESGSNIIEVNIEDQMRSYYIDYSMSVIVGRALPDVRDGLKPVHRRVLFGMYDMGVTSDKPYKKSARIVGDVLGKYHPHGDSSVYDTMVRMAQPWSLRYPLIDGQGNFGSIDGDSPAAMRYTEVRMQKISQNLLSDIEKETVDNQLNFDDSLEEPTVLPSRIPNLIVNGASGIAVGMATNMLPHNLTETIDACIAYIENNDITIDEITKYIKAPDFPTGGIIYGYDGVKKAFETGRGKVKVRGKVRVDVTKNNREQIIIYELPYQVNKANLHQKIANLVNNKIIEGISDLRDESDRNGMRLVVDLKKDAMAQVIINQLYKHTELQTSFGVNNVALVDGRPRQLHIKDLISEFVKFRHEIIMRRTRYELRKAEERAHIIEGYMKVISTEDALDRAIKIIRESKNPEEARNSLIESFELSEIQAKAILELRLARLTGMELDKIKQEYAEIMELINHLKNILETPELQYDIVKEELLEVKEKFGDERKTDIEYLAEDIDITDLIAEEDMVVTISNLGYIKRTSASEYRSQKRGGKGAIGGRTREEDFIEHMFIASTHSTLLFFTDNGRCFWLRVYEIPEADKTAKGRVIQNLLQLPKTDSIKAIIPVRNLDDKDFTESHYIVTATKRGIIKKTVLSKLDRPRANGVIAVSFQDGDQLLDAKMTDGDSYIMLATSSGRAIRFPEEKVRPTGRGSIGVTGISMDDDEDQVIGLICVNKEDKDTTVLAVSENGLGKRTSTEEYRITNRGGKGVKTMNINQKTGKLVGLLGVKEEMDLMITCKSGITIRTSVEDIRETGRATQGVRLINLKNDDQIAAITKVEQEDDEVDLIESEDIEPTDTDDSTDQSGENTNDENKNP